MSKLPFKISLSKKAAGTYCCAYGCTNNGIAKKAGLCHKHYARKTRALDPVYARYNQMKCAATQRKISFLITIDQFRAFCNQTGYIVNKGYRGMVATIDRIDNNRGYSIDNIQIMSLRANVHKFHNHDKFNDVPF